jgi:hypothetical protein
MDVKVDRNPFFFKLFEGPASKPPRKNPKISTTPYWEHQSHPSEHRDRKFLYGAVTVRELISASGGSRDPVPIVEYGNDAAIEFDSLRLQNFDGPEAFASDRKTWRTEVLDRISGNISNCLARLRKIDSELHR